MTPADERRVNLTLGAMLQPGLATAYPDLKRMLDRLYEDRVAKLPWVPSTWLQAVRDLQAANPADLVRPTPGYTALGLRGGMAPSWADTTEKLDAWQAIYDACNAAIIAYAAKQADIGAAELRKLEADAAFWDGAYQLATTVRNLPANITKTAARGASDFVGTFLPESMKAYAKWVTVALLVLIVGGVVLWYRKRLSGLVTGLKG